jgi:hypothetical protein
MKASTRRMMEQLKNARRTFGDSNRARALRLVLIRSSPRLRRELREMLTQSN